jgi:hypothetical protein
MEPKKRGRWYMKNVNQKEAHLQSFEACFLDRINPYFIRHDSIQFRTAVALHTLVVLQAG